MNMSCTCLAVTTCPMTGQVKLLSQGQGMLSRAIQYCLSGIFSNYFSLYWIWSILFWVISYGSKKVILTPKLTILHLNNIEPSYSTCSQISAKNNFKKTNSSFQNTQIPNILVSDSKTPKPPQPSIFVKKKTISSQT